MNLEIIVFLLGVSVGLLAALLKPGWIIRGALTLHRPPRR